MAPDEVSNGQDQANAGGLSQEDRDTISEMTNIAMGASVSTLSVILGQEADLATPQVQEYSKLADLPEAFPGEEKLFVLVQYVEGFSAASGYILKLSDAKMMASLMMGGNGSVAEGPFTDLEHSSIVEAMNQMMTSAATSMTSVIHRPVEISTPEVMPFTAETLAQNLPRLSSEPFTAVNLDITLSGGKTITMIQYTVSAEARKQVGELLAVQPDVVAGAEGASKDAELEEAINALGAQLEAEQQAKSGGGVAMASVSGGGGGAQPRMAPSSAVQVDPVTVRPVEFASFDSQQQIYGEENKNLNLVMDVSLSLTVELGKTELSIKDVLELTRGSVIELDRVAGEPVDLLANGKLIAKGEVVVIEDNFGLRITSIVSPADRLRGV